jgi:hypothetical protein
MNPQKIKHRSRSRNLRHEDTFTSSGLEKDAPRPAETSPVLGFREHKTKDFSRFCWQWVGSFPKRAVSNKGYPPETG